MKPRYTAMDLYDFNEILVETDDLNIAYQAVLKRIEDTDGECDTFIRDNATYFENAQHVTVDFWGEEE